MRIAVALVLCLSLSTTASADAKTNFEEAWARWQSLGITRYSFIYQDEDGGLISPRCGGALIRIGVVSGKAIQPIVVQGTRHCPTGTRGKSIDVEVPNSIDTLFDRMRRWVYDPPTKVELEVTYDSEYGLPLRWRAVKSEITDSDEGFAITNFQKSK